MGALSPRRMSDGLGREDEVELDIQIRPGKSDIGGARGVVDGLELGDEAFLHTEDGVGLDVGIVRVEDMGGQPVVILGADDVVQMRRAERMPAEVAEQVAHRPVGRNRIMSGPHGAEPVGAVRARHEDAAQIEIGLYALLLDIVESLVIGLPDVDLRSFAMPPDFAAGIRRTLPLRSLP